MINATRRFPDMKALTDYIHGLGLKAGIYTSPGALTCAGFHGSWQLVDEDALGIDIAFLDSQDRCATSWDRSIPGNGWFQP